MPTIYYLTDYFVRRFEFSSKRNTHTVLFNLYDESYTTDVGETDPPTPMGTGPLLVRRGAEVTQRADRGSTREQFLPSFGPHGCVKPYCCLFVCIEFLLRSDGRCPTERGSVSGVSNEPNWPNLSYVALGPPFILPRGHR